MKARALAMLAVFAMMVTGCVSASTYKESVGEVESLQEEKARLEEELQTNQTAKDELQATLASTRGELRESQVVERNLRVQNEDLQDQVSEALQFKHDLRRERDALQTKIVELEERTQDQATQLEAQQSLVTTLQDDKQRLMSGATTAQEEIAQMQRRAGELEVVAARVPTLEQRLSERNEEIGQLRERAGELEAEASRIPELERRLSNRNDELARINERMGVLEAEVARTQELEQRLSDQDEELAQLQQAATEAENRIVSLTEERDRLANQLQGQAQLTKAMEEEKMRLEQERMAKEAEIARLTQTHADLRESLEDEISKGNIRIQQVQDRLTINMVDRVLFDSGQTQVKQAGLGVLDEVGAVLTNVDDKQIRVEGHTDNVGIGPKLKERFPTNWELSAARATSVVRYLIDKRVVDTGNISATGYADTRPVADNETEEGRKVNRRIEIVLYPKDLSDIVHDTSQ